MSNSPDARKYLSEEELRRLLGVIKSPRDRAIFTVTYWRGLRASEVGRLPFEAWLQRKRRIQIVRLKRSLPGEYALSPAEHRALTAWRAVRGDRPGPLFPSRESGEIGRGISRGMLHVLMRRYAAAANLPESLRHMHALKHALGTHLIAKGAGIYDVKDWLGHRDIRSTLVYAQYRNKERDSVAQRIYEQG